MTNNAPVTHGMASSIRSATESEVFDLGGLGPDTIENIIADALSQPFEARSEMIRITLVVGAGKQSRQKYHAQAMKVVTSTLQNKCGFVEDRGASCVMECQGMYKVQHDTGKNLKTVVLFPKMDSSSSKGNSTNASSYTGSQSEPSDSIFPVKSMEYKAAASSLGVFQNMIKAKCATWSQKKAALQLIEEQFVEQIIEPVEDLLMRGQVVPSDLQHYYDNVLVEISEKQHFVKQAMHDQVETGNLVEFELNYLLEQVDQRIQNLSKGGGGGNPAALTKAKERRQMLKSFTPVPMPKLQHHAALGKLWKQVYGLNIPLDLDGNSGRLLSVQESRLVGKRDDLLQEIEQLEYASQGWLEDDEIFEWRVQECRSEFEQRFASGKQRHKKGGSSYAGTTSNFGGGVSNKSSSRKPITNWITPKDKKGPVVAKKKTKMKKQDLFSAMMAASSSDEEEEDSDNYNARSNEAWQQVSKNQGARQTVPQKSSNKSKPKSQSNKSKEPPKVEETAQAQADSASGGAKKKKNKKKKKGKDSNSNDTDTNTAVAGSSDSQAVATSQGIPQAILQVLMAILHLVMAILNWLFSMIFGSKKKGKKKKKS